MSGTLRLVFAGGGTGGHLFPAINLAKSFEKNQACSITFFGTSYGIEAVKIPELGYRLELLKVKGFQRRFSLQNILFLFFLAESLVKSKKILKKINPHAVIGTGGYVMGPVLKMAIKLGIPTFIQEQNSFPGVTTRLLAKDVDAVFIAYKTAAAFLSDRSRVINAPNPVMNRTSKKLTKDIYRDFGLKNRLPTILIFGGSQGAASINSAIKAIIEQGKMPEKIQLLWQCGETQYAKYNEWLKTTAYKNVTLTAFIEDMWSAYKIAHFCICRAGAMSISELQLAELPSILIPLKSAAGNHQFKNARVMEKMGCARLIEDNGLLAHNLIEQITDIMKYPSKIKKMKKNLSKTVKADGGEIIIREIYKILNEKHVWPE